VHLTRNVLETPLVVLIGQHLDVRIAVALLLLGLVRLRRHLHQRTRLTPPLCRKDELEELLADSCPMQVGVADEVCTSNVHLALLAGRLLQEDLHGRQVLEHHIADELELLVVADLLMLVDLGSKSAQDVLDLESSQHVQIDVQLRLQLRLLPLGLQLHLDQRDLLFYLRRVQQ
jgi:hypothetical protein